MNSVELKKKILDFHAKWLKREPDGKRADFSGGNIYMANLSGANL